MGIYKERDFKQWLKSDPDRWNSPASVSSYATGMGSLINWFDTNIANVVKSGSIKFQKFEWYLKNIDSQSDRDTFFSAVWNLIQAEIKNNPSNKSTLQNYKSYLNAYQNFFQNVGFPSKKSFKKANKTLLQKYSSCIVYSQADLINEFKRRILTQDRISISKPILFPIRLINNSNFWHENAETWAADVCKNIWLIVKDKQNNIKEIQILNVETLQILKSGQVIIKDLNENEYTLQTSYFDPHEYLWVDNNKIEYRRKRSGTGLLYAIPNKPWGIDKNQNIINQKKRIIMWHVKDVKIKRIGDLAIDHDIPISLYLKANVKKLTLLRILSDEYRRISGNYNLKVSATNANAFIKKLSQNDISDLKKVCNNLFPSKDMKIIGNCKLVLMSKEENSIKSDN